MRTYSIGNKPIVTSIEVYNYTKLIMGQTISRKQHLQNSWTNIKKPVHVVMVQSCPDDISLMIHSLSSHNMETLSNQLYYARKV